MTGKNLSRVIVAICITLTVAALGQKYLNHRAEMARLRELKSTVSEIQKNTIDAMVKAIKRQ